MRASRTPHPRAVALALALTVSALLPTLARAQEQPSIEMKVDRTTMSIEDELHLDLSVSGATEVAGPDISDFEILGQSSQTSIDFGRSRRVTQSVVLRPKKAGTLTIGKAQVILRGRPVAEAPAITITVTEPKAPEPVAADEALDLGRLANEPVFVRWEVPRTTFYVGEPFPLVLQLWIRTELSARNPELVQSPKLDGLLVEDLKIDPARSAQRKTLGGFQFDVFPLTAQLATPLKAGKVLVDSASLRVPISEGGFLASTKRLLRSTTPFHLTIEEVPRDGRPEGFSPRNLGQFTLSAKILDDRGSEAVRVATGQRMVLRAEVSGTGNLQAIEAPIIADAEAFEISPLSGNNEDRIEKGLNGMSGTRVFQWLVSARQPGNLTTPTLRLPYWDPVAQRFETALSKGRALEATGAPVASAASQASALGEDVGPIVEQAELATRRSGPLPTHPLYLGALALPLLAWIFVELRHRKDQRDARNPGQRAARSAHANARKRLKAAEHAIKDGLVKDFYGQLARTLTAYLEERANLPATGMTHAEVRTAARTAGYPAELVDRWVVEMENCDFARFAPSGSAAEKMREAAERVARLIDELERVEPTRRP